MRNTRIGALLASTALASATILGGAGIASAQSSSSEPEGPAEVDTASIVMKAQNSEDEDAAGRYTLTATAYDNCTVAFELVNDWPEGYTPNWRADYRVDEEDPVMTGSSRGGDTYRPVLGSNQKIEDAIQNRANPYDFATGTVTVDLTEARTVPQYDDPSQVKELPGVEANEDGKHEITFGVFQGPNTAASGEYSFDTTVTVEGCPLANGDDEKDAGLIGSLVGSVDVFGSLEGMS